MEWPFEIWDNDDKCRIQQKMKSLNSIVDDVYVLLQWSAVDGAPKQRCLLDGSHVANSSYQQAPEVEFPRIERGQ